MCKTALEYKEEYFNLLNSQKRLETKISDRLYFLVNRYPDAIIDSISNIPIKAKSIDSKTTVILFDIYQRLRYIQEIEHYIEENKTNKQLKLF